MNNVHVVIRHMPGLTPTWQYYGTDIGAIGGSDTLREAKDLAAEAVADLVGTDTSIVFYVERQALAESDDHPAIYVRELQDTDTTRRLQRQNLAVEYATFLQNYPERKDTFHGMLAATGDIIAVAVLPDDLVSDALENCGHYDSVFLGMPEGDLVYWLGLSGSEAEEVPEHSEAIAGVGLNSNSTVRDLMLRSGTMDPSQARTLLTA
ncbi:hypothetical protein [Corynebacterium sp.]|uniref:hypothetical protein n=1 Tax=Corynebacterium sp. TaxID=1720 RepID=UPI0025C39E90|nr:hypothetical protein [Corynebacterium sp.]